jgi:hypothetical protein
MGYTYNSWKNLLLVFFSPVISESPRTANSLGKSIAIIIDVIAHTLTLKGSTDLRYLATGRPAICQALGMETQPEALLYCCALCSSGYLSVVQLIYD